MSETHFSFSPTSSVLARRWRWALLLLLSIAVVSIPQYFQWQWLLQLIALILLIREWWPLNNTTVAPFTLASDCSGRTASGRRFYLSQRSRLLPMVVWLHSDAIGWQWIWQDSLDDTSWRRLCRIALKAQRANADSTSG